MFSWTYLERFQILIFWFWKYVLIQESFHIGHHILGNGHCSAFRWWVHSWPPCWSGNTRRSTHRMHLGWTCSRFDHVLRRHLVKHVGIGISYACRSSCSSISFLLLLHRYCSFSCSSPKCEKIQFDSHFTMQTFFVPSRQRQAEIFSYFCSNFKYYTRYSM